jgi:hypothetical protein
MMENIPCRSASGMAKILLKDGACFSHPNCKTHMKEGNILAVFDSRYRIIAEYPIEQINSIDDSSVAARSQTQAGTQQT